MLPADERFWEPEYRRFECGAYRMPFQVPVLPEKFNPVLLVAMLANSSIPPEYGAKLRFTLGALTVMEPVATRLTLDVTVVLMLEEKLMFPFT